ncbi:putative TBC1 domain family member 5 [Blattamonas nauphoetae]|uniref:TBC1 domain family member 5 n=1 Tax=Blattamonas nauphoetae TaxID=2049346 RepID=A0ABQ9XJD6_9EUKA|nr:putative TBC1 domain family member 5 [Blattamonas nauphoetae]
MDGVVPSLLTQRQFDLAVEEFASLFDSLDTDYDSTVRSFSIKFGLDSCPLRGILWRYFLGLLEGPPSQSWIKQTTKSRTYFTEWKQKVVIDPREASQRDIDFDDPLSSSSDSSWSKFFENKEIEEQISRDLARIHYDIPMFQNKAVLQMLLEILLVWAKINAEIGYKQGMHEILAGLAYGLIKTSILPQKLVKPTPEDHRALLSFLMDFTSVQADLFAIFDSVMQITSKWFFDPVQIPEEQRQIKRVNHVLGTSALAEPDSLHFAEVPAVVRKSRRIFVVLKSRDADYAKKLDSLQVEPHLYMLPWLRLLFLRVFPFPQSLRVWDALFAASTQRTGLAELGLVDYQSLALLLRVRGDIMNPQTDANTCLSLLMHFPHTTSSDVERAVADAIRLKLNKEFKEMPTPTDTSLDLIGLPASPGASMKHSTLRILEKEVLSSQFESIPVSERMRDLSEQMLKLAEIEQKAQQDASDAELHQSDKAPSLPSEPEYHFTSERKSQTSGLSTAGAYLKRLAGTFRPKAGGAQKNVKEKNESMRVEREKGEEKQKSGSRSANTPSQSESSTTTRPPISVSEPSKGSTKAIVHKSLLDLVDGE